MCWRAGGGGTKAKANLDGWMGCILINKLMEVSSDMGGLGDPMSLWLV